MEYSISKLSKIAGVSTRTLRYYNEIGLLSPKRVSSNGYRVYGQNEIALLQQIMFFRELEIPLEDIKEIICSDNYNGVSELSKHLMSLKERKAQIEALISNVEKTIAASKGEIDMSDKEKFEGFKKKLVDENEKKYGKEIREKYGSDVIDASNAKMMGLSSKQYEKMQNLSVKINETLKLAFEQGDPSGELAQNVCAMHKEWLMFFWTNYSKEAHVGLAQTYVDDERFKKYYDSIVEGCAEFLRDALVIYCK